MSKSNTETDLYHTVLARAVAANAECIPDADTVLEHFESETIEAMAEDAVPEYDPAKSTIANSTDLEELYPGQVDLDDVGTGRIN